MSASGSGAAKQVSPSLAGRVVVVIGAGSGIGAAVAHGCGAQGAVVVCGDLDAERAEATARTISDQGGVAHSAAIDVLDREGLAQAFDRVAQRHGRLDGVVSTPGVNVRKPLLQLREEEFDRVVDLNLKGTFFVLQAAGERMRQQRSGSVVIFSSIRSQVVEPGQGVYAATKAGIVQLVRALAAELGPAGVRVNAVAPGVVETPLTAPIQQHRDWYQAYAQKSALRRWARAEEMAGPAVFLLSDAASYVTGSVLFVDGGWTAVDGRFEPPGMA